MKPDLTIRQCIYFIIALVGLFVFAMTTDCRQRSRLNADIPAGVE